MSTYGLTMNASVIRDENRKYTVGVHLKDSLGMNVNKEGEDTSLGNLLDGVLSDVMEDEIKFRMGLDGKTKEDTDADDYVSIDEYDELIRENDALVDRIDELEAKLAEFYDHEPEPEPEKYSKQAVLDTSCKNVTKKPNADLEQAIADILKGTL